MEDAEEALKSAEEVHEACKVLYVEPFSQEP